MLCAALLSFSFKYIPCSYLSIKTNRLLVQTKQFKYIPCSYLSSVPGYRLSASIIQIHPMFLFIWMILRSMLGIIDSNTSHVLIYLCNYQATLGNSLFKYIPCSYLSNDFTSLYPFIIRIFSP